MEQVDVLLTPALTMAAPYIGQAEHLWEDGTETVPDALIRCPAPFNITGQPAMVVPCGLDAGLPVGLQIVGRPFAEVTVLRVGAALEAAGVASG
jgi:aspartyl-tRNA(Asn)/glutamyl-tRNA(Gln) amidotransferase subunit A